MPRGAPGPEPRSRGLPLGPRAHLPMGGGGSGPPDTAGHEHCHLPALHTCPETHTCPEPLGGPAEDQLKAVWPGVRPAVTGPVLRGADTQFNPLLSPPQNS